MGRVEKSPSHDPKSRFLFSFAPSILSSPAADLSPLSLPPVSASLALSLLPSARTRYWASRPSLADAPMAAGSSSPPLFLLHSFSPRPRPASLVPQLNSFPYQTAMAAAPQRPPRAPATPFSFFSSSPRAPSFPSRIPFPFSLFLPSPPPAAGHTCRTS